MSSDDVKLQFTATGTLLSAADMLEKRYTSMANYHVLDKAHVNELKSMFSFFAGPDSDLLSAPRLKDLLENLGLTLPIEKCEETISQNSQLGETGMSFFDFLLLYSETHKERSHISEVKEVFRLLDDDGDGYVEVSKLRCVLRGLCNGDKEKAKQILSSAYPDRPELQHQSYREFYGSGKLSFEDFERFLFS